MSSAVYDNTSICHTSKKVELTYQTCYKAYKLTLRRYGIDSKYIDVADILFVSVIKP